MKTFIKHRVNKISDLAEVHLEWGVEIDLRSHVDAPGKLFLSHDPWTEGDDFEVWLEVYAKRAIQGPLILNTKEDGLETRSLELLRHVKITNFFFLDTTLPTLVKWTYQNGRKHFAARYSVHEPIESVQPFIGKVDWLWVDCFGGIPVDPLALEPLHGKVKLCLVSPELHGKPIESIKDFRELYSYADAICTKQPEKWAAFEQFC